MLAELKRKSLCDSLAADAETNTKGLGFRILHLYLSDLSEEGLDKIDEILKLVFQYINMLKKEKPQQFISDEINHMGIKSY